MRKILLEAHSLEGCCGVAEIHDFPEYYETDEFEDEVISKPLTDEEWYYALSLNFGCDIHAVASCIFTHSSYQDTNKCSPRKFAHWLRGEGESVRTGAIGVNKGSGNRITVYSWAPSKKFRKKLIDINNKKNTINAEFRGVVTA